MGADRLCVLVRADLQKPGACLRRVPTQLHCDLLRLGVEVAPPCFRRVLPHHDDQVAAGAGGCLAHWKDVPVSGAAAGVVEQQQVAGKQSVRS